MIDPFLLNNIKKIYQEAQGVDKTIAKYILLNLKKIGTMHINDLANECFVSRTSIIRFCARLNLDGFRELKYRIKFINKANVHEKNDTLIDNSYLQQQGEFNQFYSSIITQGLNNVNRSFKSGEIARIAEHVMAAKKIYFFGFALSYWTVQHFVMQMTSFKNNIFSTSDWNYMNMYVDMIEDADMVFIVCISGQNDQLMRLTKMIRDNSNAKIIVLVGNEKYQFKIADKVIVLQTLEQKLWDSYSITAQSFVQWFDFLFYHFVFLATQKNKKGMESDEKI